MEPTGMKCARCGKDDSVIDLEADLVSGVLGTYYVLLICKKCLSKRNNGKRIELKYNYRVPVHLPKDKEMIVTVKQKKVKNTRDRNCLS